MIKTPRDRILGVIESEAYPRLWHIKDQTGLSEATIRRHLKNLVDSGHIVKHFRPHGHTYWNLPERER